MNLAFGRLAARLTRSDPLIPATMPEDMVETFGESTPLGRAGQPAQGAPAFVFLASAEASYITGEVLAVTGGKPVSV